MFNKETRFAKYSKGLCWVVSVIWLALAVLSFTGGNGGITGFLWLAGAIAFAVSAISIGKSEGADAAEGATDWPLSLIAGGLSGAVSLVSESTVRLPNKAVEMPVDSGICSGTSGRRESVKIGSRGTFSPCNRAHFVGRHD